MMYLRDYVGLSSFRYVTSLIAAMTLAFTAGCALQDDGTLVDSPMDPIMDEDIENDIDGGADGPVRTARRPCDVAQCGSNAATLNQLPIGELHLFPGENTGELNNWDARIVGFMAPPWAPGGPDGYTLEVERGRFKAVKDDIVLEGPELEGSHILIDHESGDESDGEPQPANVIIREFDRVYSWTRRPHDPYLIDRYLLTTIDDHPICNEDNEVSDDDAWAVVISGERYSWEEKAVTASGVDAEGWFNIACQNNALYDMKFQGYDPDPRGDNKPRTTAEQRQATLKMITADYCGTGFSFTETGTPLHWVNDDGWSSNGRPQSSIVEAKWNHEGAVCIERPRLFSRAEILAECGPIPRCADYRGDYEWRSENPGPPES